MCGFRTGAATQPLHSLNHHRHHANDSSTGTVAPNHSRSEEQTSGKQPLPMEAANHGNNSLDGMVMPNIQRPGEQSMTRIEK